MEKMSGSKELHIHSHSHEMTDPSLITSRRGIRVVKWSFVALMATALVQLVFVGYTGSIALFSDTLHNFGDALTAIPLYIAFRLSMRPPTPRYSYGYGRLEDLAGLAILAVIFASALFAIYESVNRFLNPQPVSYIWAVAVAAVIGMLGNELVARYRMREGRAIGSAALVADGQHARVDALTSLAVLIGVFGVWAGFPLADPAVGFIIGGMILLIARNTGKSVFRRLMDGVDPAIIDEIRHAASHVSGVIELSEVRVRWLGHRLQAELNITVDPSITVEEGHEIAMEVQHQLLQHLKYLDAATIHVDPATASGESFHHMPTWSELPQPDETAE